MTTKDKSKINDKRRAELVSPDDVLRRMLNTPPPKKAKIQKNKPAK